MSDVALAFPKVKLGDRPLQREILEGPFKDFRTHLLILEQFSADTVHFVFGYFPVPRDRL